MFCSLARGFKFVCYQIYIDLHNINHFSGMVQSFVKIKGVHVHKLKTLNNGRTFDKQCSSLSFMDNTNVVNI